MTGEFDAQSLRIFSGADIDVIQHQFAQQLEFGEYLETFSGEEMMDCYRDSVEQGIEIDETLWQTLDELVARILVESTDSSRAGAGD
jgi:hypothetical protein